MNWTERLAKVWNLGDVKLQTLNGGLLFAVCSLPDAKGLYYFVCPQFTHNIRESNFDFDNARKKAVY